MFRLRLPLPAAATLHAVLLATIPLGAAARPARAQNLDSVQVRTERVAEGIYVLIAAGGNIGVSVGPDGAFLIDDQFAPLTPKVTAAVAGLTDRPIRFVLNTHYHFDHTGGNENLGKAGALLVAHGNVRRRMSTRQFIEAVNYEQLPSPPGALPVVTFSDTVTFHLNGDEIAAFHVPRAHTDGDAIIHFRRANVVHMGDVYVTNRYPLLDLRAGGSIDGVIGAVERVLGVTDDRTRLIPGHGAVSDRTALQTYRDMLTTIRDRVRRQVGAGATLEAVLAARPSGDFDAQWGKGSITGDRFVETVYRSLAPR